jgi:hypothetical protein
MRTLSVLLRRPRAAFSSPLAAPLHLHPLLHHPPPPPPLVVGWRDRLAPPLLLAKNPSPSHPSSAETSFPAASCDWLAGLRRQFPQVFFQDAATSSVAPAHGVQHLIQTTGQPATAKFRRLDPARLAAAKREFQSMLSEGIIRRSSSQWSSPLHMVQKKDGSWRPCGDYRQLNLQTVEDKYPLPNMADLAARLDGCRVFSKLDLRKGYLQVPVAAADIAKTAIITPFGLFEFTRMPFGLRNAGMTFQRLMDTVLGGLPFAFVYLDDILVASPDEKTHWFHFFFSVLQQNGLIVNPEKCLLACSTVDFLGHRLSSSGIGPLPSRVQAIADFPRPATVKQLQAFLGLFNFYRRFIPAAAKVVHPLTGALRGGPKGTTTLAWTPAMAAAFLAARGALSSSAVLAHPAAGAEISIVTDASATHVGAVVQQRRRGGAWRPLGFFSAQLNKAEVNYSAFDRELLAVVAAIRHFRYMLEGRSFVVFTDHKPLVGALHRRSDPISARQQRHLSFIAEFAPSIRHITGASNVVADTLSRPSSECSHPPPLQGPAAPSVAATYSGPSEADQGSNEVKVPSGSSVPPPPLGHLLHLLLWTWSHWRRRSRLAQTASAPALRQPLGYRRFPCMGRPYWLTPHLGSSGPSSLPPFAARSSRLYITWHTQASEPQGGLFRAVTSGLGWLHRWLPGAGTANSASGLRLPLSQFRRRASSPTLSSGSATSTSTWWGLSPLHGKGSPTFSPPWTGPHAGLKPSLSGPLRRRAAPRP